jgi:hypothetical protein
MKIHMDDCRVHHTLETSRKIRRMKIERLSRPPHRSPDNFWFFGSAKTALRDRTFADADTVVEPLTDHFEGVTFEALQSVFQNWIERLEWIIRHSGQNLMK